MIDHVSHDGHDYDDLSRTQKGTSQRARFATEVRQMPHPDAHRKCVGLIEHNPGSQSPSSLAAPDGGIICIGGTCVAVNAVYQSGRDRRGCQITWPK